MRGSGSFSEEKEPAAAAAKRLLLVLASGVETREAELTKVDSPHNVKAWMAGASAIITFCVWASGI